MKSNLGKIVRLDDTGTPAKDNPFADQGFVQDGLVGDRIRMRRYVHAGEHAVPLDVDA